MKEVPQIWWKDITGPQSFIADVANSLLESSVIVRVPDDLPWRHEMRKEIEEELRQQSDYAAIGIKPVDAEEELAPGQTPAEFVLEKIALNEIGRSYRRKAGKSVQDYIIEKGVLKNRVLWIKGLNAEQADSWIQFAEGYRSASPQTGLIVLEIRDDIQTNTEANLQEINYSDYISEYNLQLFNSILLDKQNLYSESWKRYLSALAAKLCSMDAELSDCFINCYDHYTQEPVSILSDIAAGEEFRRRGSGPNSGHILAICRSDKKDEIKKRIWAAQLQAVFSVVESKRIALIEKIFDQLISLMRARDIKQFGEIIENPYDFEWGALKYAMNLKNLNGEYYLSKLSAKDREQICNYREYRNAIAHGDCCSLNQLSDILK